MAAENDVLLVDVADRVATVTMNRPDVRNALNRDLRHALRVTLPRLDGDDGVDVVILTGADPAFCAGLDLRELGGGNGGGVGPEDPADVERGVDRPWPVLSKPLIGAVNGVAITGGFELALLCDFLIASERARFGDTHARVGIMPGWGLSVLLPQAIGLRRAIEMSMTGNFVDAEEALRVGLVNHVVPHDDLLPTAQRLAADIVGNDQATARNLLASYRRVTSTTVDDGLRLEAIAAREWQQRFDPAEVERRRQAIIDRGRTQRS